MSDDRVFTKCAWRLVPFMALLYVVSHLDRVNAGFAALTMNKDLNFSPGVYGFGAGILFVSFAFGQIPANLVLMRLGARRWLFSIMAVWGVLSAGTAFVRTPIEFYVLRFVLGAAESGFFVGAVFYLSLWFPEHRRARCIAGLQTAIPLAFVIGGPVSSLILGMEGVLGLHGWQWLFLIEGLPAVLLAIAVLTFLPDSPTHARWLSGEEKRTIAFALAANDSGKEGGLWPAFLDPRVYALGLACFCAVSAAVGVQLWLPLIAQTMGYSNTAVGFIAAFPALLAVAALNLFGRSSDIRKERIWHAVSAILLTAMGFAGASIAPDNRVELAALMIAFVFSVTASPLLNTLVLSFLRGPAAAAGFAVYSTLGMLGGFAGPYILGALKESTGTFASGQLALAFLMTVSAAIVLSLKRSLAPLGVFAKIEAA